MQGRAGPRPRSEPKASEGSVQGPGCWFRIGACELHVSLEAGADNASSKRHFALEVDDLGAWRRRLADAGCAIEEGRPVPGVERFFARDPAGNRVELFSRR